MEFGTNYRVDATFRWLGSTPVEGSDLSLTVCGIENCKPDKSYGPTVRNDYHVHFVLSGKGVLEINNQTYHLHRGQIFVIPPDIETYYYADSKDPWQYTWISFSGNKAKDFLEKAGITSQNPVRDTYIQPEEFLALTEDLLNHHELTTENELIRTSLLYRIIALLIESKKAQDQRDHKKLAYDYSPSIYVKHALEYIHHNYQTATIQGIADYIGITRSYLTHIFKENLNVSTQEYLISYRLEQSCHYLRTTNLSIQEISEKVGYTDSLAFSKVFKSHLGMNPKNYRIHYSND